MKKKMVTLFILLITFAFNASYLSTWISAGTRKQITRTYYDSATKSYISAAFGKTGQQNLRTRVASICYFENNSDSSWTHASHYSYDEHGNVNTLIQDFPELSMYSQRFKRIDYDYDIASGKVNNVDYQGGKADQWHHRYDYDADNRLTDVYTSIDSVLWDKDASYSYYLHGPLARNKLGRLNVQGVDYAYTIEGWLKGVNCDYLNPAYDIGQDGNNANLGGANRWVARDAYGFSLGYFAGDYTPVNATNLYATINYTGGSKSGVADTAYRKDLFNGNIAHMVTAIGAFMANKEPLASVYRYDQLNRLMKATYFNNMDTSTHTWGTSTGGMGIYQQTLTYDANGNILTQVRDGDGSGGHTSMDQLTYNYNSSTNQLNYVADAVSSSYYPEDIDNESSNNYLYDGSGNLVHDVAEQIDSIKWSPYGKVREIKRTSGSTKKNLKFDYGPYGQRWKKTDLHAGDGAKKWKYLWYVRDAQGNVMAIYKRGILIDQSDTTHLRDSLVLDEQDMYGSARLGLIKRDTAMVILDYNGNVNNTTTMPVISTLNSTTVTIVDTANFYRITGQKRYELTNHLGNVLETVSDRRMRVQSTVHGDSSAYFMAEVITANDYYAHPNVPFRYGRAFGSPMPGRSFKANYCDTVTTSTTTYPTDYDTTLTIGLINPGEQITMDAGGTNYVLSNWNPAYMIQDYINDILGTVIPGYTFVQTSPTTVHVDINIAAAGLNCGDIVNFSIGTLSSYMVVITCTPIVTYSTTVTCDTLKGYRYAFNGKEKDDETYGEGDEYDYGNRMYDPRLGRWMSIDPIYGLYSGYSPYSFALNTPIQANDAEGKLVLFVNGFRFGAYQQYIEDYTLYEQNPFFFSRPTAPWVHNQISFDDDVYHYWGNVGSEFANDFMLNYHDYNRRFIDGMNDPNSTANERYETGKAQAATIIQQIKSGEIKLKAGETIKIVGHSHGSAYAAGLAFALKEAHYQVEAVFYVAPQQPGDIVNPTGIRGVQYSRQSDEVSSKQPWSNRQVMAPSTYAQIKNITEMVQMPDLNYGRGGHWIWTFENIFKIPKGERGYVGTQDKGKSRSDSGSKKQDVGPRNL